MHPFYLNRIKTYELDEDLKNEKSRSEKLSNENRILSKTLETFISNSETKEKSETEIQKSEKLLLEEITEKNILIKNLREKLLDFERKIENFQSEKIFYENRNLDFETEKNLKIALLEKEILNLNSIFEVSKERTKNEEQIMKNRISDEQIEKERHLVEEISKLKLQLEDIQVRHHEMVTKMKKENCDVMEKERKKHLEDADVALLKANSVSGAESQALLSLQSQLGSLRQQLNK